MDGLDSLSLTISTAISTWLTPTVLFLLLNLVIGTIAYISKPQTIIPPLLTRLPSLSNPPSFLQRLSSTGRFQPQQQQQEKEEEEVPRQVVERTRSDPVRESPVKKELRRSATEKKKKKKKPVEEEIKRPETVRERKEGDEEVDAKADDFISKFRNQLKLQRLDSIIRYKDMLNRGK